MLHSRLTFRAILIIMLTWALNGCDQVKEPEQPGTPVVTDLEPAKKLEQEGKYIEAAQEYQKVAAASASPQKERLLLQAVHALILGQQITAAKTLLDSIQPASEQVNNLTRKNQLNALVLITQKQAQAALDLLTSIDPKATSELVLQHHQLRAQAFMELGNHLEHARERVLMELYLTDADKISENHKAIKGALDQLTPAALMQLMVAPAPDILSGWMNLIRISKTSILDPERFANEINLWKQQFPSHPALQDILPAIMARHQALKRPEQIAVILPLSGKLKTAANAIRNGILAAHYLDKTGAAKTTIRFYDSGKTGADIRRLYERAVKDGAEYVVGPLSKRNVGILATSGVLQVPVLALNTLEPGVTPQQNFFQFALSPEDEARQVAERTILDGYLRAAALIPTGNWGDRISAAFTQRYTELGGEVVQQSNYSFSQNDFSGPIQQLLNLDQSYMRYRRMLNMLNRKIEFEPRRRQDIDFIFLAAYPKQARLIAPQLRFHHAANIPVYATSHAYNGTQKERENRDMNGIRLCDSAWTLSNTKNDFPMREQLKTIWPTEMERFPRLFALGIDAYQVPSSLQWMKENPAEQYQGKTGILYLGEHNQVKRILQWAQFVRGQASVITPANNTSKTGSNTTP